MHEHIQAQEHLLSLTSLYIQGTCLPFWVHIVKNHIFDSVQFHGFSLKRWSLLVILLTKTVLKRAGLDAEHQSKQLFRQRLPASDNISGAVQFGTFILPLWVTIAPSSPATNHVAAANWTTDLDYPPPFQFQLHNWSLSVAVLWQ